MSLFLFVAYFAIVSLLMSNKAPRFTSISLSEPKEV